MKQEADESLPIQLLQGAESPACRLAGLPAAYRIHDVSRKASGSPEEKERS
jgi:hypothetical protein